MNKIFILCLLATLVFSCKNNDEAALGNPCAGVVESPDWLITCYTDRGIEPHYCSIVFVGDFELEEISKAYQPQYCEPSGKTVRYKNVSGGIIDFKIMGKAYQKANAIYSGAPGCKGDSSKFVGYCIDYERLDLRMKSDSPDLDLSLSIQTQPDLRNPGPGRVGDFLVITRKLSAGAFAPTSFVINKRTLSYEEEMNQVFLKKVELSGNTYLEVLTNDITFSADPKPYKYYFNRDVGLIGFVDPSGTLWIIEE